MTVRPGRGSLRLSTAGSGMICVCNAFSLKAKGVGVDSGDCRCCCCSGGGPAGLSCSPGRFRLQRRDPSAAACLSPAATNLPSDLRT